MRVKPDGIDASAPASGAVPGEEHVAPATPGLTADDDVYQDETAPGPRRGRARGVAVAAVVIVIALAVVWVAMEAREGGGLGQDPFGRAAPTFELPLLGAQGDGAVLALEDLRGQPVVLNFWASWCGPCKDEAPILAAAEPTWREQGVVFLGVDSQDAEKDALAFEERYGIGYESVVDEGGELASAYGVFGFPETFFIDADGLIRAKQVGAIDAERLDTYIASILE